MGAQRKMGWLLWSLNKQNEASQTPRAPGIRLEVVDNTHDNWPEVADWIQRSGDASLVLDHDGWLSARPNRGRSVPPPKSGRPPRLPHYAPARQRQDHPRSAHRLIARRKPGDRTTPLRPRPIPRAITGMPEFAENMNGYSPQRRRGRGEEKYCHRWTQMTADKKKLFLICFIRAHLRSSVAIPLLCVSASLR